MCHFLGFVNNANPRVKRIEAHDNRKPKKKVYIISNDQRDTWSSVDCTVGGLETNKLRIICVMKTNQP
jgi:hypothetical protein